MTTLQQSELTAVDLPITLYLNQRLTFDLLAAFEGGFSSFATVQTTAAGEKTSDVSGEARFGLSNAFALFGVQLGAQASRQTGEKASESTTKEIIHTPASLFARLRRELRSSDLVHDISLPNELENIQPGDFVEFNAILRKNPLVEVFMSFSEILPLGQLAALSSGQQVAQSNRSRKANKSQDKPTRNASHPLQESIDLMLSAVTAEGSQDLIAEVGRMPTVLTIEQNYFIDPTMNDAIDGTFRVFGKATRVITDDSDSISLMRKTAMGKFGNIMKDFDEVLSSIQSTGFSKSVAAAIPGPTMQVFPIAIFS